ncbi:MAG: type II toxin-antitoxin system RatA family toxin [Pseudomonadota bacterium]
MRQVKRSALVSETPARMFELINDIASYPQFVPWCSRAEVLESTPGQIVARLEIRRSLLHTTFTTRNTLTQDRSIAMRLVEGPFRSLEGLWTLTPIVGPDAEPMGCRVELQMKFEFANVLTARLLEAVFEQTVAQLVDAFVRRARSLKSV